MRSVNKAINGITAPIDNVSATMLINVKMIVEIIFNLIRRLKAKRIDRSLYIDELLIKASGFTIG